MAPEILKLKENEELASRSKPADIFALAIIIYQASSLTTQNQMDKWVDKNKEKMIGQRNQSILQYFENVC